jgi:hypothetical protein
MRGRGGIALRYSHSTAEANTRLSVPMMFLIDLGQSFDSSFSFAISRVTTSPRILSSGKGPSVGLR